MIELWGRKNSYNVQKVLWTLAEIDIEYMHRDVGSSVRHADDLLEKMMRQPDYREAVAAYTEKRSPRWGGESE